MSFIDANNLVMVNKDINLCTGTFTRITPHSSSILDYLLVSKCMIKSVLRMGIDSDVELLSGSDHVAIRFDLSITGNLDTKTAEYNGIFLSDRRDMKIAQREMDQLMDKIEWDNLSLNEWGEVMQNILINANVDSYNTGPRKKPKPRSTFRLKRLKARKKELERKEKRLSLEKIKRALANEIWTIEDQNELNFAAQENQAILEEVNKRSLELKCKKTNLLRMQSNIKNEQFWRLARKTTKKKGGLSIIKGPDGKIETERDKVADLAITELAKVFIGQKSPIFESHGHQIIKEIIVKNNTNYEKWIPQVNDEFKYESEVCAPCSKEKIIAIIKSIKAGRAPGVDGV